MSIHRFFMLIISHRGYWKNKYEKNKEISFRRSFELGFGTETDIRDYKGALVVSHDPVNSETMSINDFFKIYKSYGDLPLAINIKANGLANMLSDAIKNYNIYNYFVFDMSIPDGLDYLNNNINFYTRQSEYEKTPLLYEDAKGVWIDCFVGEWIKEKHIKRHLSKGKKVCIVSPELHSREHKLFWSQLSKMKIIENTNVILCTDFPEEAKVYFSNRKAMEL